MKTFTGLELNKNTLGVVYLCEYDYSTMRIDVIRVLEFSTPCAALEAYANIPNPESQIATGATQEQFYTELARLHRDLSDPNWVKMLADHL